MSRAPIIAALALAALALSGCIKADEVVTLNDDGTVHVKLQYGMADETIAQTERLIALGRELQGPTAATNAVNEAIAPFSPSSFEKDALQKEFDENRSRGVVLDKLEATSRDAWKYVTIECTSSSLDALSHIGIFREQHLRLMRGREGNYEVSLRIGAPEGDDTPMPDADSQEYRDLRALLLGFQVLIRVETPGEVIDANTTRKTAHSATWDFELERNPNALRALQRAPLQVTFSGKGLKLPAASDAAAPAR